MQPKQRVKATEVGILKNIEHGQSDMLDARRLLQELRSLVGKPPAVDRESGGQTLSNESHMEPPEGADLWALLDGHLGVLHREDMQA